MSNSDGIEIVTDTIHGGKSTFAPGSFEQQQARADCRKAPQFLTRKPRIRPTVAKKLRDC